jgi:hypothetical protein
MPDPVVVSAAAKHTATLVFLHGLGDTGRAVYSAISDIRRITGIKFVRKEKKSTNIKSCRIFYIVFRAPNAQINCL